MFRYYILYICNAAELSQKFVSVNYAVTKIFSIVTLLVLTNVTLAGSLIQYILNVLYDLPFGHSLPTPNTQ